MARAIKDSGFSMETVKILFVNTGSTPITTEKLEFPETEHVQIKKTILTSLNRLGKLSHAVVKHRGGYYVCEHTARKGPSKKYFEHVVKYHRYLSLLD